MQLKIRGGIEFVTDSYCRFSAGGAKLNPPVNLKARLIVEEEGEVRILNLAKPVINLGRGEDNDIIFTDRKVSRRHAVVRFEEDHFVIEDMGSSGGTFVNKKRIDKKVLLNNKDIISLGEAVELRYEEADLEEEKPPLKTAKTLREIQAELVLWENMKTSKHFPIIKEIITIGREDINDIVIDNLIVSRWHSQIIYHNGEFTLYDLHSSNGTAINGERIGRKTLENGDVILLGGEIQLIFKTGRNPQLIREGRPKTSPKRKTIQMMESPFLLKKQINELSVLNQVSASMHGTRELKKILQLILKGTTEGLGYDRAMILLVDEEEGVLTDGLGVGVLAEPLAQLRIPLEEEQGLIAWAAIEKKPYNVVDADRERVGKEIAEALQLESFAVVPLIAKGEALGVLIVDNIFSSRPIEDVDIKLLMAFAHQTGLAIENAQLYERIQKQMAELKFSYEELRNAQEQLIQAEKMGSVGQLAEGIAHEIENPIGIILGFSQAVLKRVKEDGPMAMPWRTVEAEANYCKSIIRNLLDFSRPSEPNINPTDIVDILEGNLALLEHQIVSQDVVLLRGYEPDLPKIEVDAGQIKQVLMNMILNSLQSMPKGGVLGISVKLEGEAMIIEFSDTGYGIPKEDIPHIFDPFSRSQSGERKTGLSLPVSYSLIKRNGGEIEVKSKIEEGSVFTIKLPLKSEQS